MAQTGRPVVAIESGRAPAQRLAKGSCARVRPCNGGELWRARVRPVIVGSFGARDQTTDNSCRAKSRYVTWRAAGAVD